MDKRLNALYLLFSKTIDSLRHSGLVSTEDIEVLLFMLLWKHQSDNHLLQGKLALQNVRDDIPEKEIIDIADNVIDTLNLKYSQRSPDVLSIKVTDLKPVLPKIISAWKDASEINFNLWNKSQIQDVFTWINDYLGGNLSSASEFFTPGTVAALMSRCIPEKERAEIYDPSCRSCNLLETMVAVHKKSKGFGVTTSAASYRLARIQGIMLDSKVIITTEYLPASKKYDVVVTNPPFNVPEYMNLPVNGDWSRAFERSKSDIAFLAHAIDALKKNGTCAVIMPMQFLSGGGVNKKMRQELIDQNILESVVTLPAGLFFGTPIPAVIIFVVMGRKIDTVKMVDASGFGEKEKGRNVLLSQEEIETLVTCYRDGNVAGETENPIVINVSAKEIAIRDYDLRFNTFKKRIPVAAYRPSKIIREEIFELEAKLTELQRIYWKLMTDEKD